MEPEGCQQDEVGEDDGVSFPSADFHFVLEVGFFERVVGEFSHTGVAVCVGAFLRDVGGVVVEEEEQVFACCDGVFFGEGCESVDEPLRQVLPCGAGGEGGEGGEEAVHGLGNGGGREFYCGG